MLLLLAVFLGAAPVFSQYLVGDYGAPAGGNWTTLATWRVYDGSSWASSPTAVALPGTATRVHILAGSNVVVNGTGPYNVGDLFVEATARLWANNSTNANVYITINGGTLHCDGQIGNGTTYDALSFNTNGANVTITGAGQIDISRIRKNGGVATTNLLFDADVNLRFNWGGTTALYNELGASNYHIVIAAGRTLTIDPGLGIGSGNLSIDGVSGADVLEKGGSVTVNGSLLMTGILYLHTNNTNAAYTCGFTINTGGYVRVGRISSAASGTALHTTVNNDGGLLEIIGTNPAWSTFSATNNTFTFASGSHTVYSGAGIQDVRNIGGGYGHLTIRGSGTKTLTGVTIVKGDLNILNTDGAAVLATANLQISVGGNWSNYDQSGFTEGTGIVLFNLASSQTITTTGGEVFWTWRISKTAGSPYVVMGSNVTVTNNFNLPSASGKLDLNGHRLTIANPATTGITGSFGVLRHIRSERTDNTSVVQWNMGTTTGAHLIPFGTDAAYTPFTFNLTAGNAGNVSVATYGTGADNLPLPVTPTLVTNLDNLGGTDNAAAVVDRFWQVDVPGTTAVSTMTFVYAASELPGAPYNTATALHAQRWNSPMDQWDAPIEGQTPSAYSVVVPGVTAFGPWTISAIDSPLPIELLTFDAKPDGRVVELSWATATERNNDHFTVLRSADGLQYEPLMRVAGAGNSQGLRNYHATDDAPLPGTSYYKLRQTDHDGTSTESAAVAVRFSSAGALQAWPNPATTELNVAGLADGTKELQIVDAQGRLVATHPVDATGDRAVLPVESLPPGVYILRIAGAGSVATFPFVRQ